jgi:hypothetical protein
VAFSHLEIKHMQYVTTFLAYVGPLLLVMLKVGLVIGGTGSVLEEVGKLLKLQRLVTFGQLLEHIGADVPGFVDKIRKLLGMVAPLVPMLALFLLSFTAGLACSPFKVDWPKLGACAEPLRPGLTQVVGDILASNGDAESDLATLGKTEGLAAVECAVQQLVSDIGSSPVRGRQSHIAERGRAFLAKVRQ